MMKSPSAVYETPGIFPKLFNTLHKALRSPKSIDSSSSSSVAGSMSTLSTPSAPMVVCRICENSVPSDDIEAHSEYCSVSYEIEMNREEVDRKLKKTWHGIAPPDNDASVSYNDVLVKALGFETIRAIASYHKKHTGYK
jgi:hypothetical protein